MTTYILDRQKFRLKYSPHHVLHAGSKVQVPVIDAGNPLGDSLTFAGVVEPGGEYIRVHVPVSHGGPAEFAFNWREEIAKLADRP